MNFLEKLREGRVDQTGEVVADGRGFLQLRRRVGHRLRLFVPVGAGNHLLLHNEGIICALDPEHLVPEGNGVVP